MAITHELERELVNVLKAIQEHEKALEELKPHRRELRRRLREEYEDKGLSRIEAYEAVYQL